MIRAISQRVAVKQNEFWHGGILQGARDGGKRQVE
jgi:hypothetical protein